MVSYEASSCVAVQTNPGFTRSVAAMTLETRCILGICVVILMTGFPSGHLVLGDNWHGSETKGSYICEMRMTIIDLY